MNNEIPHFGKQPYVECNHPPGKVPLGDRIEGRGWGTSNEHMEINSKNPQENIVDLQFENNQRANGHFKGNNT